MDCLLWRKNDTTKIYSVQLCLTERLHRLVARGKMFAALEETEEVSCAAPAPSHAMHPMQRLRGIQCQTVMLLGYFFLFALVTCGGYGCGQVQMGSSRTCGPADLFVRYIYIYMSDEDHAKKSRLARTTGAMPPPSSPPAAWPRKWTTTAPGSGHT